MDRTVPQQCHHLRIDPLALASYEVMEVVVLSLEAVQGGWVAIDEHPLGQSDGFRHRVQQVQLRAYATLFTEDDQQVNIRVGSVGSQRSGSKQPDLSKPVAEHPPVATDRIRHSRGYGALRRSRALLKSRDGNNR